MFCEKLQNVCSEVFIPEQMDKKMDAALRFIDTQNPQIRHKL